MLLSLSVTEYISSTNKYHTTFGLELQRQSLWPDNGRTMCIFDEQFCHLFSGLFTLEYSWEACTFLLWLNPCNSGTLSLTPPVSYWLHANRTFTAIQVSTTCQFSHWPGASHLPHACCKFQLKTCCNTGRGKLIPWPIFTFYFNWKSYLNGNQVTKHATSEKHLIHVKHIHTTDIHLLDRTCEHTVIEDDKATTPIVI